MLAKKKTSLFLGLVGAVSALPDERQEPSGFPSFVTEYAPVVRLYSTDPYRPSDISAQLANTEPQVNFSSVVGAPNPLTLDTLDQLNGAGKVFLTSNSDPTASPRPQYLYGVTPNAEGRTEGANCSTIIVVDRGNGAVDAFYLYFYAFDYGGDQLGGEVNVGNHVGDWEHNVVRFANGTPTEIWFSQHSGGQAFTYEATEKYEDGGVRPVIYSANGTHANYASAGTHNLTVPGYNLPEGSVQDHTDAGPVWDPTLSAYYYSFNTSTSVFTAYEPNTPVNWLYFTGNWGDEKYPKDSPKQKCILGIDALCQYSDGPTGPIDKDLDRKNVCPDSMETCLVLDLLAAMKAQTRDG